MEEQVQDFIEAIKATAEMSRIAYDAFREQGFSKSEALELVKAMVATLMGGNDRDE